jgi:valyl-tRNA synthetase
MNIAPTTLLPLQLTTASAETQARAGRWAEFVKRLARLSTIDFVAVAPQGAVQLLVRGEIATLPLKGVIDLAAERTRLEKEMARVEADIKRVDAKLSNADFMARAPEEVVDGEKEKREEAQARRAKLIEALERLKGAA